ncbi:PilN domain-containing protein [Arsukibacterium sp.]|uniref:PilN domain-containing protein n=1 Tax=Arsukibacterium sp. TaxID=1977258 RepID=UPI002FDA79DB
MMKQQVNLYSAQLTPQHEPLSLKRLLQLEIVIVTLLVIVFAVLWQSQQQQQQQLRLAQQELQQQQQQLQLFQQAVLQRSPLPQVVAERDSLQLQLQQQQALQTYLAQQQQQQRTVRYSVVLQHFDEANVPQLWLTRFRLNLQQASLEGMTTEPAAVPRWLQSLRQFDYFKGQKFNQLALEQSEHQQVTRFILQAQGEQP